MLQRWGGCQPPVLGDDSGSRRNITGIPRCVCTKPDAAPGQERAAVADKAGHPALIPAGRAAQPLLHTDLSSLCAGKHQAASG